MEPSQQPPQQPSPEAFHSQPHVPQNPDKTNGFAIAGLILAFIIPLLGLIFSIVGLKKAKNYNGSGKGLSIAGIVVSAVSMLLSLLIIVALLLTAVSSVQRRANEAKEKAGTVTQTKKSDLELGDTYTEKSGAYSIKLPKGWKVDQLEGRRDVSAIAPASSGDYVSAIYVGIDKVYPGETLADFVSNETESITKYEGGTIKSEKDVTINGASGHELIAHKDTGGSVQEAYTVILMKGDSVYKLDFKTSPERSDNYLPVFEESAKSFTIL